MAFTVFVVTFMANPPWSTFGFFSSAFRSRMALDTTVAMTEARVSHNAPMADATPTSNSLRLTEAEPTILAVEALAGF